MVPIHPRGPGRAGRPRLLRRLLAAAGLFIVICLIGALALTAWRASVDRRLDAGWRRSLGGASFLERYPATQENATVRDLEKLGAAIGIDMAPFETPGHVHPAPEAAKRFEAIKEPLKDFYAKSRVSTEGTLAPPPPRLAAFLESVRPGLDAIRSRLAKGPAPVWARDLEAGWETKIPNYLGVLMLQKLLLLDAGQQLRAGRETQAGEILETSWRLNQAMADNNPVLIPQLMALVVTRLQQPVLRSFSRTPAGWSARLLHLDLQSRVLLAFQGEVFSAHRTATLDRPVPEFTWGPTGQAFLHWMLWDATRRVSPILEDLPRRDVRSFDPDAFELEQRASMPRWQIAARSLFPNSLYTWPRSAHAELEAELTALILEERERLAAGGPPRSADHRPSRVKGLSWIYEDLPRATVLHLDGDLRYQDTNPAPLRFTVRRVALAAKQGIRKASGG
jgi:hypothetical protein